WAVTELYSLHYHRLVGMAALLVRDVPTAEDVGQDSFVAMHAGWQRVRDAGGALAYMRQGVAHRFRAGLPARGLGGKSTEKAGPGHAECRARRAGAAGTVGGDRHAAQAARPAARGDRAAVLRRSLRG